MPTAKKVKKKTKRSAKKTTTKRPVRRTSRKTTKRTTKKTTANRTAKKAAAKKAAAKKYAPNASFGLREIPHDAAMMRNLKAIAKSNDMTISEAIRWAIIELLKSKRKTAGMDPAIGPKNSKASRESRKRVSSHT